MRLIDIIDMIDANVHIRIFAEKGDDSCLCSDTKDRIPERFLKEEILNIDTFCDGALSITLVGDIFRFNTFLSLPLLLEKLYDYGKEIRESYETGVEDSPGEYVDFIHLLFDLEILDEEYSTIDNRSLYEMIYGPSERRYKC